MASGRMTDHRCGEVVWYPALFADYDRPYLLISSDRHPFHGDEHIGLAITTSEVGESLPIEADSWVLGELPKSSAIKPWNPAIIKPQLIRSVVGVLRRSIVDAAVSELTAVCTAVPPE